MMKTRSIVSSFLFSLIAVYGTASITIDGENNVLDGRLEGGKNTQFNQDFRVSSQESNYNNADVGVDDSSTIVDCYDDCEDVKTAKKYENLSSHYDSWNEQLSHNPYNSNVSDQNSNDDQNRSDTDYWLNNQYEKSSTENLGSDDEDGDRPYRDYKIYSLGFDGHMLDKMAALDQLVVAELQRHGDLLDVVDAMPVKKCVVKVDKRTYVSLGATKLRRMDSPVVLEYLSVDATGDRVRVECAFDELAGNGTYKTNLKRDSDGSTGQYVVDMGHVRSNVTARFHRGRRPWGTVVAGSFAVRGLPSITEVATVAQRYRAKVERSVLLAVHEATHHGLVARLKSEMNAPMASATHQHLSSGHTYRHHFDSVSYTRLGHDMHAYRMRFDVRFVGPVRWTSMMLGTASGRSIVNHIVDIVRIRMTVVRSIGGDYKCLTINAQIRFTGLTSVFADGLAASSVWPTDVQRSFAAYLEDLLGSRVCNCFATQRIN